MIGNIEVSQTGITVETFDGRIHSTLVYERASIEALEDATRVLAEAMQLPSEDLGRHCQLVSQRDQVNAMLQNMVTTFSENN